ncbi:MAG: TetR/AcrR family transcriptional regulator [Oscillatoria sp. PMC 1051.18]|nr:TetR/AcrR family transcriptional regulator [Oscillatoria sp. PMC 1050.18]MEC5028523.1 TetR/AcrR family transcriptional regulator [Oscillatoria sp. PMC 1051.18]
MEFNSNKSDKAKAILAGALEVFTKQGYAAASMSKIASVAGVSKPTLYNYFQDKEGLFVALIEQLTHNNRQMVFSLLSNPDLQEPPEKVLHQIATSVLENFARNRPLLTLMRLIIGESERFPELARTFVREIQKPLLEQLSLYLASQPQLNLSQPMVTARIFTGTLVHYLIIQHIMYGSEILPLEQEDLVNGLIESIAAAKKSQ